MAKLILTNEQIEAGVAEFLAKKTVTKCPPATLGGNEICLATRDLITKQRKEFRKNKRLGLLK